jgi:hypothetical protein
MAWVVDTSVVVDLITGDPLFEPSSTACLHAHLNDGLVVSPEKAVQQTVAGTQQAKARLVTTLVKSSL